MLFARDDIAIAYQISSNVLACLYWPQDDMRLPIGVIAENDWKLVTWSIQNEEKGGQLCYLIILHSVSACVPPKRIVVESHFGAKALAINDPARIGEASPNVANRCAIACIRGLAAKKIAEDEELLAVLGPFAASAAHTGDLHRVEVRGTRRLSGAFVFVPSALFVQAGVTLTRLAVSTVRVSTHDVVHIDVVDRYGSLLRSGAVLIAVSAAGVMDTFVVEAISQ